MMREMERRDCCPRMAGHIPDVMTTGETQHDEEKCLVEELGTDQHRKDDGEEGVHTPRSLEPFTAKIARDACYKRSRVSCSSCPYPDSCP